MGEKGEFRHGERGMVVVFRWAALSILDTADLLLFSNTTILGGLEKMVRKRGNIQ